jgi:CheY-like chemotaxis protein
MPQDRSDLEGSSSNVLSKLRVLIIDDDKMILAMVKQMLRRLGITQVFEAEDGSEGLAAFRNESNRINLIICDWQMPKMTGLAVLEQVRAASPKLPFIMLTATTSADAVRDAKSLSVDAYIAKPFSQNQLRQKLEALAKNVS